MDYSILNQDERANLVEGVYTPLSLAIKTLHERQNDLVLRKKVDDFFLEHNIPTPLLRNANAFDSRSVASHN